MSDQIIIRVGHLRNLYKEAITEHYDVIRYDGHYLYIPYLKYLLEYVDSIKMTDDDYLQLVKRHEGNTEDPERDTTEEHNTEKSEEGSDQESTRNTT